MDLGHPASLRTIRLVKAAARLYAAYVIVSVALLMPLLNFYPAQLYQAQTGRTVQTDLLGFNPFTLSLFGYGLEDRNADGSLLWRVEQVTLNFSALGSLLSAALAMDAVALEGLVIAPAKLAAGQFNFSDILEHRARLASHDAPATDKPAAQDARLPRIKIDWLLLDARLLQYLDYARPQPYRAGIEHFRFQLEDFSTLSEDGDGYHLKAQGPGGGNIEWRGHLAAAGARTWGELSFSDIPLKPFWEFLSPQLRWQLDSGRLSFQTHYLLDWSADFHWQLTDGWLNIDLLQLAMAATAQQAGSAVGWHQLHLAIERIDSAERTAQFNTLVLDQARVESWHAGQRVGLVEMFSPVTAPELPGSPPAPTAPTAQSAPSADTQPWSLAIRQQHVNNASLRWTVPELDHRTLTLAPIDIQINNLSNSHSPADASLTLKIDDTAQLAARADIIPDQADVALELRLDELPLAWANPLLDDALLARIGQGTLNSQHRIQISGGQVTHARSALQLADFALESPDAKALAAFRSLQLHQLDVDLPARQLAIAQIELDGLDTGLTIHADGSTNLADLLKPQTAPQATNTGASDNSAAPWSWAIDALSLSDARIAFADESLLSPFRTRIQQFGGTINRITSNPQTALQVDLKGNVDGYAPVTLKGQAQPLLPDPAMNLALDFRAMDLGVFNPYATTFMGWKIEKGLLSVSLDYQLQDKKVVGNNRMVLDNLTLGERVQSVRLIDLPIRLALALLTDENGVADLRVPVKGSTDDPEFSVGSILWQALRNSLVKLVAAPFNLLAGLVDSQEDLGQVAFAPGSDQLTAQARSSLTSLKAALDQRPQLRLGITGDVDWATEAHHFRQQQLDQELLAAGLSQEDIDSRSRAWLKAARQRLQLPGDDAQDADALQAALLAALPEPQLQLDALAQARALHTKQFLLNETGLAPERVFVHSESQTCPRQDRCASARAVFEISQ